MSCAEAEMCLCYICLISIQCFQQVVKYKLTERRANAYLDFWSQERWGNIQQIKRTQMELLRRENSEPHELPKEVWLHELMTSGIRGRHNIVATTFSMTLFSESRFSGNKLLFRTNSKSNKMLLCDGFSHCFAHFTIVQVNNQMLKCTNSFSELFFSNSSKNDFFQVLVDNSLWIP